MSDHSNHNEIDNHNDHGVDRQHQDNPVENTAPTLSASTDAQTSVETSNDHSSANAPLATPVIASATAPVTATLGSDGFEHQSADLNHTEVHGAEATHNAIQGSTGNDVITGGSQSDVLGGGNGSDTISAGAGDDILVGGGSSDAGINHLDGGAGNDILVAGGQKTSAFNDFFVANGTLNTAVHADAKFADVASILDGTLATTATQVENDFTIHSGSGNDLILNFHAATDKIVLDHTLNGSTIQDGASLFDHMVVNGSNVSLDLGQGNSITLVGVDASNLSAANFVIV